MSRERGHTLLELLVALSCAGLLMALLAMVGANLIGHARAALGLQAADEEREIGLRWVRELVSAAIAPDPRTGAFAFVGDERELAFFATPPEAFAHLGVVKVRLFGAPNPAGGQGLFVRLEPAHAAGPGMERLLVSAGPVRFAYLAAPHARLQTRWQDATGLPARIDLALASGANAATLRLSAYPRRTVHSRCGFDSVSLSCR